jgi:mannose/fructose/N-acetylgalactosamine-specific phosphotransferase system component IIC
MSFLVGQAIAYLKIGVLALAVMAVVWAVVKFIEARGRRKNDGGDGRDGC